MTSLSDMEKLLDRKKGERDLIRKQLQTSSRYAEGLKTRNELAEEARLIIQKVAQDTQKQLEFRISELVTLALHAVFPDPYDFKVEFVLRRNKTEADLYFERDGERIDPMTASGGGAVDVAAFALRVALWSLRRPRSRNVLILDEPFRFISRNLQSKAALMLSELSKKLNLQIIMVSHNPELIEGADKTCEVTIKRGVSHVKEIV